MRNNSYFIALSLILAGLLSRTVLHIGPNIELVTTSTLLASVYIRGKRSIAVPLLILMMSDLLIGNTNIFIFTWSAYLIIWLTGGRLLRIQQSPPMADQPLAEEIGDQHKEMIFKIIKRISVGIGASVWFYLWTNFGVWLLDSWGMYPHTLNGLINCYLLGLPFLKLNVLSNAIFVPAGFLIAEQVKKRYPEVSTRINYKINKILLYGRHKN